MKIAIMQPYLFPYIGYFQVINYVDKFVIYDDVNYIKGGWINRNNILVNDKTHLFTLPLNSISSFTLIKDIYIDTSKFNNWTSKFLKTINQSYKRAPYFENIYPLLIQIFLFDDKRLSPFITNSLMLISRYLGVKTNFEKSSSIYQNSDLKSQERVLDICRRENATEYINPIGGMELYNKDIFLSNDILLYFLKSRNKSYKQFSKDFAPWLSVIDVMMFNSMVEIQETLLDFDLV